MNRLGKVLSVVLLASTLAGSPGCEAVVEREGPASQDPDDVGGEGEAGGGDEEGDLAPPDAEPTDGRFALCAPPPELPGGLREGTVPAGSLGEEQARAIFQRASHEVGHLTSALLAQAAGEPSDLFLLDGDALSADRDGEALRGTITRDAESGLVCAAVTFGSWTGGHGGWGLSALDGALLLLLDGDEVTSRGTLGLVDAGPLEGAPSADVHVDHAGELVSGQVGGFSF